MNNNKQDWLVIIMNGNIKFRYEVSAEAKEEAIQLAKARAIELGNEHEKVVYAGLDDWLSKQPFNACCPE